MKVIAVVSAKGGVGKTTITANISAALASSGHPVLAIDLDPQNALRMHFGMSQEKPAGLAKAVLAGRSWRDAVARDERGVDFLPYGILTEDERIQFEGFLGRDEDWLARTLSDELKENVFVTLDTPPGPSIYLTQALRAASFALIVIVPDAASYITLPAMESLIQRYCRQRRGFYGAAYVLNQLDTSLNLQRDIQNVLRTQFGDKLVPVSIHRDVSVCEALAFEQPVLVYASHSQASHDIVSLTQWLIRVLADNEEGRHP